MVGTLSFLPIIKFKLFNPQMKNFIGWWLLHCHFKKNFFDLAFLVIQSEIPFRNFQNILVYYQKIIFWLFEKNPYIRLFDREWVSPRTVIWAWEYWWSSRDWVVWWSSSRSSAGKWRHVTWHWHVMIVVWQS